jgi:hypothetical protein
MNTAISDRTAAVHAAAPQGAVLRIVPILGPSHDAPPYRLLEQKLGDVVQITEISASGSVPELKVVNRLDVRLLLIDGQELVGAKQNRILNTDVLVPAGATLKVPVSCVEAHRWSYSSRSFSPGKSASHRTRSAKHQRVHAALRAQGRHDADQSAVWQEVDASLQASGCVSPTAALSDAYAKREQELAAFRRELSLPEDAVGVAAFHGNKLQGIDLFDRHETLRYFWESLVDSYAIDWLSAPVDPAAREQSQDQQEVKRALESAAGGDWEAFDAPGEGQDWRLDHQEWSASALVWEEKVVIHLQLFPRRSGQANRKPRIHRPWR